MRALPICLSLWCLLVLCGPARPEAANTDPIDKILLEKPTADSDRIESVRRLIEQNPRHPRILELRYFRTGQLMGSSQDPQHFRALIQELEGLAEDAGRGSQMDLDCRLRIGEVLFHCLRDKQAAYDHYKSLEQHPALGGNTLASDYQRVDLYCRIAAAALAFPVRQVDEVEKYTRLVMAYPYLGMEDRRMYRKFFDLYEEAGRLFITAFDRDAEKLLALEIYPSHEQLWKYRKTAVEAIMSDLDGALESVFQSVSMEAVSQSSGPKKDALPVSVPGGPPADPNAGTAPRLGSVPDRSPAPGAFAASRAPARLALGGSVFLLVAGVLLILALNRRTHRAARTPE